MAKMYDFRINLQKAIFDGIHISVVFGGSETRYGEFFFTGTLADAIKMRQECSDAEPRPHAASLGMRYRDARKATGINNVKFLYANRE